MAAYLLLLGFVSILAQVVVLRELNVAFYGVELIYVLALGVWLLGTGVGARLESRTRLFSGPSIAWLCLLFALLLPADVLFVRGVRILLGGVTGAYLSFPRQMVGLLTAVIPLGIVLGLLFQWMAKQYLGRGGTLVWAYALESAGAVIGGLVSTAVLRLGLSNLSAALLCSLVITAFVSASSGRPKSQVTVGAGENRTILTAALVLLGFAAVAAAGSGWLDRATSAWNHPFLSTVRDSPYGRVVVTSAAGQVSVYENDELSFETEGTSAEELAHLAALQHPHPRTVLLLGGGLDGTIAELLKHDPDSITYVELNPTLLKAVEPRLPLPIRESLESPRVRVVVADPRVALSGLGRYDLILIGMPDPSSGQTNRFYTQEFYEQARSHLVDRGVLTFRLRSAENYWSPALASRNSSVIAAAQSVFSDVVVLPGVTNIVLASAQPLTRDPELLVERYRSRGIVARLVTPEYIRYLYTNDRFLRMADRLSECSAPVNTDQRPICYYFATSLWLSKFFPRLFNSDVLLQGAGRNWLLMPFVIVCGAALAAFLAVRRRPRARAVLVAATAGLCGILIETVVLLQYQMKYGVLYQDLGLLLTAFMLGLSLGAASMASLTSRLIPPTEVVSKDSRPLRLRSVGLLLLLAFAAVSLIAAGEIAAGHGMPLLPAAVYLILTGFLVAALFSWAVRAAAVAESQAVAPLYSADLLGGAAGTILAGVIWIPIIGMAGTALLCVLLCLLAVLLV